MDPDDILIGYDFQGGSQRPTLSYRRWTGSAWIGAGRDQCDQRRGRGQPSADDQPLAGPLPGDAPAFTFGEAAINLTGLGLIEEGDCSPFSSAYVKSRASSALHLRGQGLHRSAGLQSRQLWLADHRQKQTFPMRHTTEFHFEVNGAGIDDPGHQAVEGNFSLVDDGSDDLQRPDAWRLHRCRGRHPDPAGRWTSFVCDDQDRTCPVHRSRSTSSRHET